jgi:hypothetical protein
MLNIMKASAILSLSIAVLPGGGMVLAQDAEAFIQAMEKAPPEKRPPHWEQTKALMDRRAPAVGEPAPDFSLKSLDGKTTITRTRLSPGKPQVLIFGSYT